MAQPQVYREYEIETEVFQHRVGRLKGSWGSSFSIRKVGAQPAPSIVAASCEKTAEAALDKAYRRAKTIIDDRETHRASSKPVEPKVYAPRARPSLQER